MEKKDRKEIFELFKQAFTNKQFQVLSGLNPCIIQYNGTRYNVYIKNLTPAQLSNNNPDVWRCQLPKRPIFDDFKKSDDMFLLLGYDASNDVYATWNPYWAKQRLNIGESVSMYSRFSIQEMAAKENGFIEFDLNHKGIVVVFPRLRLAEYLDNCSNYFSETTYVPIGSSLRKKEDANTSSITADGLFEYFTSEERLSDFAQYLTTTTIGEKTQKSYIRYIKFVFEKDFFNKYRPIFIKYNNIADYEKAVAEFYSTEEIAYIDRNTQGGWHGAIKAAMKYYFKALCARRTYTIPEEENVGIVSEPDPDSISIHHMEKEHQEGKPNIETPELIEKIAPLMCKSEPQEMEAMQVLYDYFGDKYSSSMQLLDWIKLLRGTNWSQLSGIPNGKPQVVADDDNDSAQTILKITLADGTVIFHPKSIDTYIETIEALYPDLIAEMDIQLRNAPLVSFERINDRQREIKGGYFLSVCSHTKDLAKVIETVANQLGEPLTIEIVSKALIAKSATKGSEPNKNLTEHLFYVKTKSGVLGKGYYSESDNTFVLLAGSRINASTSPSFNRKSAYEDITKNYCVLDGTEYLLQQNYEFNSPSTASSVTLGRSSNGWKDWKDENGIRLNSFYQKE